MTFCLLACQMCGKGTFSQIRSLCVRGFHPESYRTVMHFTEHCVGRELFEECYVNMSVNNKSELLKPAQLTL